MTRLSIVFLLNCCSLLLFSQSIDLEHFKNLKIRNIGPAGMSGRVTSIDVINDQPNVIYIGTASGGVWRSKSGGITWEPIFDEQPVQSIGALAINQQNPSEIWVGTGEGNPRNSHNSGEGIYKSLDGGKTWQCMGLKATKTIHRIIIHRDDPNTVYVAALGSAWGNNEERGVYRTRDGGENWEHILSINDSTGCADLVVDPSNPNKLIAAMWEFGRKPWTFNSGGEGSGIYITFDGGVNWKKRTEEDGLPKGILGRIGLGIAPSDPDIIYALVEAKKNGLYKSTDGGFKWKLVSTENIGNRPFYYADIFVDPQNENRLFNLWSHMSKSEDGGKTFERFGRGTHPDHHAFWVHPENPDYMIEGNDGGVNISHDGGANWQFVETLPLAQFYHISYDMDIPYHVAGGMQDNGSWVGPSAQWKYGGIRNYDWQEVYFGDGFDVVFKPDDNRYVYAMSQGGFVSMVDRETGDSEFIRPVHPEGEELRFSWNSAIAQNPFHNCGIYFGSQYVHKSMDCGDSWEIISPDLTTNDSTKQRQFESGGLTIDDTRAENHTTILAIAPSPVDENVIWVGTDDGNLQLTKNGGKTWQNLGDRLTGANPGSWIPYIELSRKRAGEAFVVVNDYRRNDWRPMVYHTTDFGQNFRRIADEDKVRGHALSIVQDPEVDQLLWLGTDYGLYFSIDGGGHWQQWNIDFPSVPVRDLKIHPREHDLIVGTFGRAAWILDDTRAIRELARSEGEMVKDTFSVLSASDGYLASYRSYDGEHFPADAHFSGQNRSSNALITIWTIPESDKGKNKKAEKNKADKKKTGLGKKLKIQVLDEDRDTIRTFTQKVDRGIARFQWNLRRDGVRYPSRRKVKPDADPASGRRVLPGEYMLIMTHGDYMDSIKVSVKPDPRLPFNESDALKEQEYYEEFYKIVEAANAGWERIKEGQKTIKRVNGAIATIPDSTRQEIQKLGKSLQDSLTRLEELYFLPRDFKGIRRSTDKLGSAFWGVSSYLRVKDGQLNPSGEIRLKAIREQTEEVIGQLNRFFSEDFAAYQETVEAIRYSLFKELEPVRIE
ncbi:MAG: hypothetical protein MI974_05380 [Chitinophagales bacterium]|nr:hypothetical protein [Chitinophagales bacterium]